MSALAPTPPPARRRPHVGEVIEFDAERALGTVRTAEGRELGFHSTAIADGSRTVEVGATVAFLVRPGGRGRWEAAGLVTLPAR